MNSHRRLNYVLVTADVAWLQLELQSLHKHEASAQDINITFSDTAHDPVPDLFHSL